MRYKLLGKSGLRVAELCLGTMTFGDDWGWGAPKDEARAIFDAYVEAGGNFIDTANNYTNGTSERLVGAFVASDRDRFVIATKYTLATRDGDPNAAGNSRKNMMQSVEASLNRLGTDHLDLLWLHAWDFLTPVQEVMRGLDDLVRAGKVRYVGVSDTPAWVVSEANALAYLRGWTPFVGLQIEYSLAERTPERDLLPMARAHEMAVLAWSPLAAGVLTGKYLDRDGTTEATRLNEGSKRLSRRNEQIARAVVEVAEEVGRSPAQVAMNWIRQHEGTFVPIIGARKVSQVEDTLGCLAFELNPEQVERLDEVSTIDLGFPHAFLREESVRQLVYGDTYDRVDALSI